MVASERPVVTLKTAQSPRLRWYTDILLTQLQPPGVIFLQDIQYSNSTQYHTTNFDKNTLWSLIKQNRKGGGEVAHNFYIYNVQRVP